MKLIVLFAAIFGIAFATVMDTSVRPRVGKGESCNAPRDRCRAPYSCVGNVGNLRCFEKRGLGDKCAKDPFWVCADGLSCGATNRCIPAIPLAGSCNDAGDTCQDGASCVGSAGNRRCFVKRTLGQKCGKDPFWVCDVNLACVNKRCVPAIGTAGSCDGSGDVCEDGTTCRGSAGNRRCFPPRLIGDKCGKDPFWDCSEGVCINEVCAPAVDVGGSCDVGGTPCMPGLTCLGNSSNRRCFKERTLGEKCGKDPFWVCEAAFACVNRRCVNPTTVPVAGRCDTPGTACEAGLICLGNPNNRRCFKERTLGQKCGKDPFWVCEAAYTCSTTTGICV